MDVESRRDGNWGRRGLGKWEIVGTLGFRKIRNWGRRDLGK